MKIRIENETGRVMDTKVFDESGELIRGITSVMIERISNSKKPIEARLDFEFIGLNVEAEAYVTRDQLNSLAAQHGLTVVRT